MESRELNQSLPRESSCLWTCQQRNLCRRRYKPSCWFCRWIPRLPSLKASRRAGKCVIGPIPWPAPESFIIWRSRYRQKNPATTPPSWTRPGLRGVRDSQRGWGACQAAKITRLLIGKIKCKSIYIRGSKSSRLRCGLHRKAGARKFSAGIRFPNY